MLTGWKNWISLFWLIVFILTGALGSTGCSGVEWNAQATDGDHTTEWNWGLEWSTTGYIGPAKGSYTYISHDFTAEAEGEYDEEDAEDDDGT